MANGVFNVAKGKVNQYVDDVANNNPANAGLVIVALQASVSDALLGRFDTLAALLADAGVTEATFTNYARIALTDAEVSAPTPDDVNDRQEADIPDQTFVGAGGVLNNNLVKFLVCFDPDLTAGDDSAIIPLTHHDFVVTTDGNNLQATINASGFYRAA